MRAQHALLLAPLLALTAPASAADDGGWSSYGTDELSSSMERVPPAVIFVLDLSNDMNSPCDGSTGGPCIDEAKDAILQVIRHFDWANFGIVGTSYAAGDTTFTRIAPVGSSYAEIASALTAVTAYTTTTSNMAETLQAIGDDYLLLSATENGVDDDGDGFTGDWAESPVGYECSAVHIIVLSTTHPEEDDQVNLSSYGGASISPDIDCSTGPLHYGDDCLYDNVVASMYNFDFSAYSGTQRAVVHTIGMGLTTGSEEDQLFQNAADQTAGEGVYSNASTGGEILSGILGVLGEIASGIYTRSTPVVSADGNYLIYTFYEVVGDNPLAQGHVRNYQIDNDPASATFGTVMYEGPAQYGGALWDGGDLLVSRPVVHAESNPEDRDGVGQRDIYFYEDGAASLMTSEVSSTRRIGFDREFVTTVGGASSQFSNYFDTTPPGGGCDTDDWPYDLTKDCNVDENDLQELVDFVRGLPTSEFKYLDIARGAWKLGDSPYSVPVIVTARNDNYSTDPTYRQFLEDLEFQNEPGIVLVPANDGMLHAFRLEDDPSTTASDEAGQELWAWIPGYLLLRNKPTEWATSLVDLLWYGRTFLFDGTPVVEDVWIDDDPPSSADYNVKEADEWHRVVVVQQGMGGPTTLALDITNTQSPTFLWEQTNNTDWTAMGYTVGRPVIFNVYDASDASYPHDRWVAMWGGGQAVGFSSTSSGTDYFRSTEASLYMWNIGDDVWGTNTVGYSDAGNNVSTAHPDLTTNGGGESWGELDYDADAPLEHSYIAAALAAVDVDGDGDGDVVYFPVTSAYRPRSEGGAGSSDVEVPGSSWMYKAIIDTTNPSQLQWCPWYDPVAGTNGANGIPGTIRPEVYYAATTAWLPDGRLGVYWGSGTPFDREVTNRGYFFAMYDQVPLDCTSTAQPIACLAEDNSTQQDGYYELNVSEGLTADPVVYAGVVYFTTYEPDANRCESGTGRVYGLRYDDCSPGLDTDNDGDADNSDSRTVDYDNYVSGIYPGEGTVYFGSANPTTDGSSAALETIAAVTDPFLGTATIAWMELY
jgi:hypothetical protein